MALPKLEGKITIPTGGYSVTISEDAGARSSVLTIAAADYYLATAGTGSRSLLAELEYQLDNDTTLLGAYTVSLSDNSDSTSTGKVTITLDSGASSFAVSSWNSSTLRDVLGFSGSESGSTSLTGDEHAEYLFLPNVGRSGVMAPEPSATTQNFGVPETDGTFRMAPSGAAARLKYNTRYRDRLRFVHLKGYKTYKQLETVTNESFEKFYDKVIGEGLTFRYYKSRDDDTKYWSLVVEDFQNYAPQVVREGWEGSAQGLWQIEYQIRQVTS